MTDSWLDALLKNKEKIGATQREQELPAAWLGSALCGLTINVKNCDEH